MKTDKEISEEMKAQATRLGLCEKWQEEWEAGTSRDELVEKFVRGLDFCIAHDFPSAEVMKRDFGEVIHRHGVWVDERVSVRSVGTVVLNGSCEAEIEYDGFDCARVWVRHRSRARITVGGLARVRVMALDECEVHVDNRSTHSVTVFRYGGNVTAEGSVSVRERSGSNPYQAAG